MYEAFKSNLWILKPTVIYLFFNFFFQYILPQACILFVFLQRGLIQPKMLPSRLKIFNSLFQNSKNINKCKCGSIWPNVMAPDNQNIFFGLL